MSERWLPSFAFKPPTHRSEQEITMKKVVATGRLRKENGKVIQYKADEWMDGGEVKIAKPFSSRFHTTQEIVPSEASKKETDRERETG